MGFSLMALLPVLFVSAGLFSLLIIQRSSKWSGRLLSPLAWLVILSGIGLSVNHFGPEFGIAIALLQVSLFAVLLLLCRASFKVVSHKVVASEYLPFSSSWHGKLALFILAGPYCIATTCAISLAVSLALPVDNISQMAFVSIFYPVLLGSTSFLICFRKKTVT